MEELTPIFHGQFKIIQSNFKCNFVHPVESTDWDVLWWECQHCAFNETNKVKRKIDLCKTMFLAKDIIIIHLLSGNKSCGAQKILCGAQQKKYKIHWTYCLLPYNMRNVHIKILLLLCNRILSAIKVVLQYLKAINHF